MLNKPAAARNKRVFVSELETDRFKIISTSSCELIAAGITAGGSAATFRLIDSDGSGFVTGQPLPSYNLESGISLAVESSNSYSPNFNGRAVPFKKGLVLVCEQGVGSNAESWVTLDGN